MYLKRDLLDDHLPESYGERRLRRDVLIGVIVSPGGLRSLPRLVACFPVADYRRRAKDGFCLNEVYRDHEHYGHLSRTSVITITGEQLADLQETGELRYGDDGTVVRLLEELK